MPSKKQEKVEISPDIAPISSFTPEEAYSIVEAIVLQTRGKSHRGKVTLTEKDLHDLVFAYLDLYLYFCYLELQRSDIRDKDKDLLLEYRGRGHNLFLEQERELGIMIERDYQSPSSEMPTIRDKELAAEIKKSYGWDFPVDNSPLRRDLYLADPDDPDGSKLEAFYASIDPKRYELPEIGAKLAAKVKDKLDWDFPVEQSSKGKKR